MISVGYRLASRRSLGRVSAVVIAMALLTAGASATMAPSQSTPRTVFIITCRCETAADRDRVADAVRRQGGSIIYKYDSLPGLAVASRRRADANRFKEQLRRLPMVTDVWVSGTQQLQTTDD